MKKFLLTQSLVLIFGFVAIQSLNAQISDPEQLDMEEYFQRFEQRASEIPEFYPIRTSLNENEMHVLDTLTNDERQIIEDAFDPPAVGIIRDLKSPIIFNINDIEIPENGEISTSGGRLSRISEGFLAFTTLIKSKKADEIRIFFAEATLPPGTKVNLFSKDDYAFTQVELRGTLDEYGYYTTTTFADYITLQIVVPIAAIDNNLSFAVTKVIHADNRYFPEENYRSCFLDANCSTANSFAHITTTRGGTARLFFPTGNKYGLCSGGQLTDIRTKDWQPFLLTANHCFDTQTSAAGLEARFSYWSTYCNSGVINPNQIIVNGANLIATNDNTDVTLVLLKQQAAGAWYLGWNAGSVANNTTMHSTHHPGGSLMKYQRMTNKTSPNFTCPGFSTSDFYYTKTTHGQEEPGSSGGLIVDPSGQVRGQLYGWCYLPGADRCDYDTYYNMWGRFDKSWTDNSFNYWLYNGGASVAISNFATYNFSTVNIGNYTTHYIPVTNVGTRPNYMNLEINDAYITGADAGQFSIIGATTLYLAPGESGSIEVRYTPTYSGKSIATLNLVHNADNYSSPREISLYGYGNPCSEVISMGGGGEQNTKTFSKSGEGNWDSDFCGYVCDGKEQVYSFTPTYSGSYSIEVTGTNDSWVDYFWKSGSCSSSGWECIGYSYSPGTKGSFDLTAGNTYYILADDENSAYSTQTFYVFRNPCNNVISIDGPGPDNEQFYAGGGYGSWFTNTASPCGYWCEGMEQVYTFTPDRSGNYSIVVTEGTGWTDYMYKTGSCSSADWICIDDIYGPQTVPIGFWTEGETYYLLLDDEDNTANNHTFYIELTEAVGTWTGLVNTNWHNAGNWSFNTIPDASIDVNIPDGTPNDPNVQSAGADCKNITIEPGATLTITGYTLEVAGDLVVHGNVIQTIDDSNITLQGNAVWESGSTLDVAHHNCNINIYGDWDFKSGANVNPTDGFVNFYGSSNKYIRCFSDNCSFSYLRVYKSDGAYLGVSLQSTEDLVVDNLLFIGPNAHMLTYSNHNIRLNGIFNYYGTFDFSTSTTAFIFDGSSTSFTNYVSGSGVFYDVIFNSSAGTTANDDLTVENDITINQGVFSPGNNTITLSGDWTNNVGSAGFDEADSRVIFNGPGHQYIYSDETFNILEADMGAALRPGSNTVICNVYDWTSGGIDVNDGIFTALDLAQSGLYGSFWVNPGGTINLTNDSWVDLDGELHNFGGTINVSGTVSDWPYTTDALVEMTGGVIDFKTCGITFRNNAHALTTNITGGTIKTAGNFVNERADADLSEVTIELYGPGEADLDLSGGVPIGYLNINKGAVDGLPESKQTDRQGNPIPEDGKADNVDLLSVVVVDNNAEINAGSLTLNGFELTVTHNLDVTGGALNMTDPADILNVGSTIFDQFLFQNGSTGNFAEGNVYLAWGIVIYEGASFTATTSNTIHYNSSVYRSGIANDDPNTVFGNIIVEKPDGYFQLWIDGDENIVVDGDFTLAANNEMEMIYNSMIVHGNFTETSSSEIYLYNALTKDNISGQGSSDNIKSFEEKSMKETRTRGCLLEIDTDFTLNGLMDVGTDGDVLVHGRFDMASTGSLIINGGSFISDATYSDSKAWDYLRGNFELTGGLFELSNNSPSFTSTATTSISGGIIRCGTGFQTSASPGIFWPTGGEVEMICSSSPTGIIDITPGNAFYNLKINSTPGNRIFYGDETTIQNNLEILNGSFECYSSYNPNLFVGGNWTDNSGGFEPNLGTVYFYGPNNSHITTDETFYNLVVNKSNINYYNLNLNTGLTLNVLNNFTTTDGTLNMDDNSELIIGNNVLLGLGSGLNAYLNTGLQISVGGNWTNENTLWDTYDGRF
ncbi:MAG: hypothetical protein B6D61_11115 [Bacteroidetes bacterium 4484_249]|nr:MAG: hypothetical protein B6D61_11115 [Bacteroidetes bacterium 4484_249]